MEKVSLFLIISVTLFVGIQIYLWFWVSTTIKRIVAKNRRIINDCRRSQINELGGEPGENTQYEKDIYRKPIVLASFLAVLSSTFEAQYLQIGESHVFLQVPRTKTF